MFGVRLWAMGANFNITRLRAHTIGLAQLIALAITNNRIAWILWQYPPNHRSRLAAKNGTLGGLACSTPHARPAWIFASHTFALRTAPEVWGSTHPGIIMSAARHNLRAYYFVLEKISVQLLSISGRAPSPTLAQAIRCFLH
jgi:hypothetical protein